MEKTAIITGASGGLGQDFAALFAEQGYQLVLVARSEGKLKAIAQILESQYQVKVEYIVQDLSEDKSASKIYSKVKDLGLNVDVLINNAGFGKFGPFIKEELDTLTEMINLNIKTLTELTALVLPEMLERNSGKILNVASTAALQSLPNFGAYAATKAYVLSFTEALHYELRKTNISVTALCPGPTETGFAKRANAESMLLFKNGMKSREVAQLGYNALMKNKMMLITGVQNKLIAYLTRLIPSRRLLIHITGKISK